MSPNSDYNPTPPHLPISLVPFAIQLQNVVPIEIVAKRFPVAITPEIPVNSTLNITELSINPDARQAQTIIEAKVEPITDPKPFEIVLKVVGIFIYPEKYSSNDVQAYLQSGSIGALLPFIRELIFQLSARLQIPPIMLPIIQLADPTTEQRS